MQITSKNFPLKVPFECPYCHSKLFVSAIIEWDIKSGKPTDTGVEVDCLEDHDYLYPYVYWHPVVDEVTKYIQENYCYTLFEN